VVVVVETVAVAVQLPTKTIVLVAEDQVEIVLTVAQVALAEMLKVDQMLCMPTLELLASARLAELALEAVEVAEVAVLLGA
jgi:hypothetical protein